jgi:hypothetical protein
MLDGWKQIAGYLEELSGRKRSRFTLMRWAVRKPDPLPITRDPSNRPYADETQLKAWWERHSFTY